MSWFTGPFLTAIGLTPMTNQELLLEELDSTDSATFERILSGELFCSLLNQRCAECKADHGNACPNPGSCKKTLAEWLEQPCQADKLIEFKEARTHDETIQSQGSSEGTACLL